MAQACHADADHIHAPNLDARTSVGVDAPGIEPYHDLVADMGSKAEGR